MILKILAVILILLAIVNEYLDHVPYGWEDGEWFYRGRKK